LETANRAMQGNSLKELADASDQLTRAVSMFKGVLQKIGNQDP
jgi:hypothetical protein